MQILFFDKQHGKVSSSGERSESEFTLEEVSIHLVGSSYAISVRAGRRPDQVLILMGSFINDVILFG
jgi:hypothetical protein